MKNLKMITCIVCLSSFLLSDYAKLPKEKKSTLSNDKKSKLLIDKNNFDSKSKPSDIKKAKRLNKNKLLNDNNLKNELMQLEKQFKVEREQLRDEYKKRRKDIYLKYGVKPPKKNRENNNELNKNKHSF